MRDGVHVSGWCDSNTRPPGPKPGALTGLRYTPNDRKNEASEDRRLLAEREGFEPSVPLYEVRQFSKLLV